ncbi:MAG: peptidoglycan-binding protein [Candidatus Pacebacteria bacterium]|nr:peptidoglycan-binding protein [Candidatus Paceibacterota bacterium]
MKKLVMTMALAFAFLLSGASVNALTVSQLMALGLDQAQAQVVAGLLGSDAEVTVSATPFNWNGTLIRQGSRGDQVRSLQACMNRLGYTTGVVDGIYGPMTFSGITAFQAANGLAVDGIVGPQTAPVFESACNATIVVDTGDDMDDEDMDDDSDLDSSDFDTTGGDEADFTDFDLEDADDDEIEEGEEMAEIAEIEFELEDEGAALLERLDVIVKYVEETPAEDDEDEPWEAFDNFYVLVDGEVIGEMEADDEDEWDDSDAGDETRLRISGIDHVFDADEDHTIVIAVDVAGSMDLENGSATWEFFVYDNSLRFIDEAGITQYLTEESGVNGDSVEFSIEEEGEEDELTVRESDNDPEATALEVEDDEKSDWYNIFTFEVDVDEDSSDLEFDEIALTLTTVGGDVEDIVSDLELRMGGDTFDDFDFEVAGTTTKVVTFDLDDEDFMIDSDEVEDIELWAEFKAANGTNYTQGATVTAEATAANVDAWDVDGGDDLDASQLKGAADGEVHTLLVDGAVVTLDSVSEEALDSSDTAPNDRFTASFRINVEAFDETIYIPVVAANAIEADVVDASTNASVADETAIDTLTISSTAEKITGDDTLEYFRISSDEDFTVKMTENAAAGDYYGELSGLIFTSADVTETGFTFAANDATIVLDEDEFQSGTVTLTN